MKALFTKYKFLASVTIISFIAVFNLHNYGIPPTHDGEYHVLRFTQFYKVLSDGILYPRWAPDFNNGFGIPLFSYNYPLPNYLACIFHIIGFGFIDSFKLDMAITTIFGSIFFYLWSRKYWGELGGVVCATFYTFSPYHFVDVYVRGSVGEVMSLGIFPALLWSYMTFCETGKRRFMILSCLSLGLLILAHNILALIFFLFFVLYALFIITRLENKRNGILNLGIIIALGFGIASPFWLPAILETSYVGGLQIFDITHNFSEIYQLIIPSWGFGLSPNDLLNPMSVQIGIVNIFAIIISFFLMFKLKKQRILLAFLIALFIFVFFLMTPYSFWFWRNVPLINYFQFPWRLLSLEILICSFVAGALVSNDLFMKKKKLQTFVSLLLIIISVGLTLNYAKAPFYHKRNDAYYLARSNFTDGTNSPGNVFNTKWLIQIPKKAKHKIEITSGDGNIKEIFERTSSYTFKAILNTTSIIRVNTAYFPGWSAKIDGKNLKVMNEKGLILLRIPPGNHSINIWLDSTLVQKISYLYFLGTILVIALISFKTIDIIKE